MVYSLVFEGIETIFSQNHPSFFPIFEHPRPLKEKTFLNFIISQIMLNKILLFSLHGYIRNESKNNQISNINIMRPLVLKGHQRPVTIVRFNYDGDMFFSGSAETKINLWESYTGQRIGSYATRASVRSLDVDINSEYLVACGNDGSLEFFEVKTGRSVKYLRFAYKLKQIQFDLGSNRFMLLLDEYKVNVPSRIKVFDFKTIFQSKASNEQEAQNIPCVADFQVILNDAKPNKIVSRALWYVDNESLFMATTDGWIIHTDMKGNVINKKLVHDSENKINSIAFSKNFAVLATAANNGSKIIDPETMEIIRFFKQELPMNAVAVSPLFSAEIAPKFHMAMGGGIPAVLAAGSSHSGFQAHICNIMHENEVGKISGHFGPINSIQFFKDGRGFISGGEEGVIRIIRFNEEYFEENNTQFE